MIAVVVSSALGKLLHTNEDIRHTPHKKKYHALLHWLEQHQSKLIPTFPGIDDERLQVHFSLQTNEQITDAMLKNLQSIEGIEGAYRKPEDSLPG